MFYAAHHVFVLCAGGACLLLLPLLVAGHHGPALHGTSLQSVSVMRDLLRSRRSLRGHSSRGVCCVFQHSLVKRGPPTLAPRALPHCCPSAAVCQPLPGTSLFQVGAAAARVSRVSSCVGWVLPAWYGAARCVSGCTAAGVCPVSAGTSRAATATARQLDGKCNRWQER
jgi:hypothetical protein